MGAPGTESGPIRIEPQGEGARGYWLHDDNGDYVAMVCRRESEPEELANAYQFVASGALYDALEKARVQFLFYGQSHLAKYPPWELEMLRKGIVDVSMGRDAYDKAQTNAEFAAMCDAALKLARGESS